MKDEVSASSRSYFILHNSTFILLWGQLFLHLSLEWSYNQQYSYGWLVPLLGLYLLYTRWPDRPPASQPVLPLLSKITLVAVLVLLLPLRVLEEANPDWRLLSWIHAVLALVSTLALINLTFGKEWAGWFGWPFAFFLVAVPWPTTLETGVIQGLMRLVAIVTAEIANWGGIPAIPQGNLIQLPTGALGVSEACSGVRSIQASVMCCAFFALLYYLRALRTALLLLIGIGAAFALNVLRTLFLTVTAASHGISSVELFHDPAGHLLVVAIFGLSWFSAFKLAGQGRHGDTETRRGDAEKGRHGEVRDSSLRVSLSPCPPRLPPSPRLVHSHYRIRPPYRGWNGTLVPIRTRNLRHLSPMDSATAASS